MALPKRRRWQPADAVQVAAVAYITVWVISPPLAFGSLYRQLALLAAGVWLAVELARRNSILLRPSRPVLVAAVYVAYTLAVEALVPDSASVSRHFQTWILLLFLVIHEAYRRRGIWQLRPVFWLAVVLFPIWCLATLRGYAVMGEHASRTFVRSSEAARAVAALGVGGYGLVYALIVLIPVLTVFVLAPSRFNWEGLRRSTSGRRRLVWLSMTAAALLAIVVVARAGYTIALTLTAIALFIVIASRGRSVAAQIRVLAFATVVAVGSLLALETIADTALEQAHGTPFEARARDVRESLVEGRAVGTVYARVERYTRSVNLFLDHPLLGTLQFDHIGKHSAMLDTFAQYGLFIGIAFCYLLLYLPIRFLLRCRAADGMPLAVLVTVSVFVLLNNVFAALGFMLYVFYPVAISYVAPRSAPAVMHDARPLVPAGVE